MFLEDKREFPQILSLKRCAARCGRERHPDDIYCAECRERATAEAWIVKRREAAT